MSFRAIKKKNDNKKETGSEPNHEPKPRKNMLLTKLNRHGMGKR